MVRVYFINATESTPSNLNLLGKLKKIRVIASSKQIPGNKEIRKWIDGEGMQVSCTLHFQEQQEI